MGSTPGRGTEILQALQQGQSKTREITTLNTECLHPFTLILVEVTVHQFNKYIYRELNIYYCIRSGAKLNELNRRKSLALLKTRI